MFALKKEMNGRQHISQGEAFLRQPLYILVFPMHQQSSKA